ncbi:Ribonuclease [Thelohanellus kitauei]|uniref:Ribonuclease n=1 Tax=Thelohanellus kitauei TaxID=669202 RepID=A0A0C2IF71_THEKT|nr:Ribonuclease [Thelohanellus kitauei]
MDSDKFFSVKTEKAALPISCYSQAVMVSGVLFISGQIGVCPKSNKLVGDDIETQTRQALENMGNILASQMMDFSCLAKTTVFLKNFDDYQKFNSIYESYLKEPFPARSVVQVSELPRSALVEIDGVAVVRNR